MELLFPFVKHFGQQISCWFFIRYQDEGGSHLRFRLRAEPRVAVQLLGDFQRYCAGKDAANLVRDVVTVSYEREIERYGADLILRVEDVFGKGSMLCAFLIADSFAQPESDAFFSAVLCVRMILENFFGSAADAEVFCGQLVGVFENEFRFDAAQKVRFDQRYRGLKERIEKLMTADYASLVGRLTNECFIGYGVALSTLCAGLKTDRERRFRLAADVSHMQLNRVYVSDQRSQEFFTYYVIRKFLVSSIARGTR